MQRAKKVLLVDDDPTVFFITETIVKRLGAEVELMKARNGQEALEIVKEQLPELNTGAIRIVLLSSSRHYLDVAKAKQYPITDYAEKPIKAEMLAKCL